MKNKLLFFPILISFLFINSIYPQQVVQNIINAVNSDSLLFFDKELSGVVPTNIGGAPYTILSRHKNQPGNDKAMTYIQQKLDSYGLTTSIQSFSTTGKNIIGVKTGTEFPNKKFMICAHFDDMPSTGTIAPGADDNASGTAAVIEAARIFKNYSFPFTIVFALWDEEEQGLIGSAYYANQLTANDSLLGVINLDMIAWDSNNDSKAEIHTGSLASSLNIYNKMFELNSTYSIGLNLIKKTPGTTASDHASFWNKGIGAILLIEENNDFNAYYHTVNDKIDYVNIGFMTKCSKLAFGILANLALNLNMTISHTPITSNATTTDIVTSAQILTGLKVGTGTAAPKLYYRTSSGGLFTQYYSVTGVPAKATYNYNFTIPAQPFGTKVQYYIAVQDSAGQLVVSSPSGASGVNPPGSTPPPNVHQFFNAPMSVLFTDNANDMNNWTATGTWGVTTAKFVSAPSSLTESPSGTYGTSQTMSLTGNNSYSLSGVLGASLSFSAQWNIEANYDYMQIQISTNNGTTWTSLTGQFTNPGTGNFQPPGEPLYDGVQSTWVNENIDLSAFIGNTVKFRFYFRSDNGVQADGFYVDDIKLSTYTIIPVELVSFTASFDKSVKLSWGTSTETNNRGFIIEKKSGLTESWNEIGFVKGAGTTTSPVNYIFEDKNISNGKFLYRLKQMDYDGKSKTYTPVEVDINLLSEYALKQNFPNPFNPSTVISYTIPKDGLVSLKVFDILGKEVSEIVNMEQTAGEHSVTFDARNLPSGMYIYQLKSGGTILAKQMLLIK